jgi:hypothetical protein
MSKKRIVRTALFMVGLWVVTLLLSTGCIPPKSLLVYTGHWVATDSTHPKGSCVQGPPLECAVMAYGATVELTPDLLDQLQSAENIR